MIVKKVMPPFSFMKKNKILFVCTGNTFRSFSAAYCFKFFLKKNRLFGIEVSSAGIEAKLDAPDPCTLQELKALGVSVAGYRQKKLTEKLFHQYNFVIAMAKEHQKFIKKNFGVKVPLFLELAEGKQESIRDIEAAAVSKRARREIKRKAVERYIAHVVRRIYSLIPKVYERLQDYKV